MCTIQVVAFGGNYLYYYSEMTVQQSTIQTIELFHLAFLGVLQVRMNQDNYVLKGGANLRYFFGSPRYSADIDFDAVDISSWKLGDKVDEVLASRSLPMIIRTQGLTVSEVTKPKQTETTQRWKVALRLPEQRELIRTKIEFSHRGNDRRNRLEQVPPQVVERYALRPPTVRRYLPEAMIEQKIYALGERAETQARDVFDLDLLFRQFPKIAQPGAIGIDRVDVAIDRVLEFSFEAFQSLIVRFLEPEVVELYDRPEVWDEMQRYVVDRLVSLKDEIN